MAYHRSDLSENLIHLIRQADIDHAFNVLWKIMTQQQFLGGTGYIAGGHYCCVCFTEAPLSMLTSYIEARRQHPATDGRIFYPMGVMVTKRWAFAAGGRPVIYQPSDDQKLLDPSIQHRHVAYDLGAPYEVDWTHEREWRIKATQVSFTPCDVTIILPKRHWARVLVEHYAKDARDRVQQQIANGVAEFAHAEVVPFPWHYIVLEDLGYPVSDSLVSS